MIMGLVLAGFFPPSFVRGGGGGGGGLTFSLGRLLFFPSVASSHLQHGPLLSHQSWFVIFNFNIFKATSKYSTFVGAFE